jgi:hypothetical protein
MSNEDLAKLKIDKSTFLPRPARRRKTTVWVVAVLLFIMVISLYVSGVLSPAVTVEVVTISEAYPYQTFTLLNASGYVVAQRKAAVASKTTSRLVWLGVKKGAGCGRVKLSPVLKETTLRPGGIRQRPTCKWL